MFIILKDIKLWKKFYLYAFINMLLCLWNMVLCWYFFYCLEKQVVVNFSLGYYVVSHASLPLPEQRTVIDPIDV